MDKKNLIWCVDIGNSFSSHIHSELFLTEAEAKAYFDQHTATHYRKMYQVEDIWHFTEKEIAKRTGQMLKRFREDAGLSQSKLAEQSGVSVRMIQHYEQGVKDINKAEALTVYRLAQALNCYMEDLLEK